MQKILIYSPKITNRIQYVFDFIMREFSGLEFELTTDSAQFKNYDFPKINYSEAPFSDEIFLKSDEIMFEYKISEKVQFTTLHEIGKCFFALSRYEEYLPGNRDKHDRFSGENKVYKTPFVDAWIIEFQNALKNRYPELEFKKRKFEFILTSDIDQAWKYKHKGWKRIYGGLLKDFIKFDFQEIKRKLSVLSNQSQDPFDTFDYFKSLKEKHNFTMIFFWLMGDYAKFDTNISINNLHFQNKIREISQWADYGIHPSYASNEQPQKIEIEIQRLSNILNKPITKSRQHYLKLSFPNTYRNLLKHGVTDDYSMSYADETGFRAGTCTPFLWYDLQAETTTSLKIHPFCAMEVAMRNYMKLSKEEAITELRRLKSEILKVKGQMTILFHNSNLNEDWKGWNEVLESVFD